MKFKRIVNRKVDQTVNLLPYTLEEKKVIYYIIVDIEDRESKDFIFKEVNTLIF